MRKTNMKPKTVVLVKTASEPKNDNSEKKDEVKTVTETVVKPKVVKKACKDLPKCLGISSSNKQCASLAEKDNKYCSTHDYFNNLTDEEIEKIKNNGNEFKKCGRCKKWIKSTGKGKCDECNEYQREQYAAKVSTKIKCGGVMRDGEPCRGDAKSEFGNKYCKLHNYMMTYTDEQITQMKLCTGCKKMKYLGGAKTCDKCKSRGVKNRKNKILKKIQNLLRTKKNPMNQIKKKKKQCK